MTQPKHTPGPWRKSGWDIMGGDNSIVASVLPWDTSGCREEDVANVDPIADAPKMLELIRKLVPSSHQTDPVHFVEYLEAMDEAAELLKKHGG